MNGIRKTGIVTALAVGIGSSLLTPFGAQASESGKRNTTYALGALTAVLGANKQWVPAAIAAVGTVIAEKNWQKDINNRHQRQDWRYGNNRYGSSSYNNGYNNSYNGGHDNGYNGGHDNGYSSGYGYSSTPNVTVYSNGDRDGDRDGGYVGNGNQRDGHNVSVDSHRRDRNRDQDQIDNRNRDNNRRGGDRGGSHRGDQR